MLDHTRGGRYYVGKGELSAELWVSGVRSGEERGIGACERIILPSPDIEDIRAYSPMTPAAPLVAKDNIRATHKIAFGGREMSKENLQLRLFGSAGTLTQSSSGAVTDEVIASVNQGSWYRLGVAPVHKRNVTVFSLKHTSGTPTYVDGTDYDLDAIGGRVYIRPGGAIASGTSPKATYTPGTVSLPTVKGGTVTSVEAFLRFVGEPKRGSVVEYEFFRVSLSPDGDLALVTDEYGEFGIVGEMLYEPTYAAEGGLYRAIYRTEAA